MGAVWLEIEEEVITEPLNVNGFVVDPGGMPECIYDVG